MLFRQQSSSNSDEEKTDRQRERGGRWTVKEQTETRTDRYEWREQVEVCYFKWDTEEEKVM